MKRYFNIFLLSCQDIITDRARAFVWMLVTITGPILMLLFWRGALHGGQTIQGWDLATISLYYLFIIVVGSVLMVHIEKDVMDLDIKQGGLVKYLLMPLPYFLFKFYVEAPYRLLEGFWGSVAFVAIYAIFHNIFATFHISFGAILVGIIISLLGFYISFVFKMTIGLIAFWWEDASGILQLLDIVMTITCGFIVPILFLPPLYAAIVTATPLHHENMSRKVEYLQEKSS